MPEVEDIAEIILGELDNFAERFEVSGVTEKVFKGQFHLKNEPFIAYVKANRGGHIRHLMICRYDTPLNLPPRGLNVEYVSRRSTVGEVSSLEVGQTQRVMLPGEANIDPPIAEDISVQAKNLFKPVLANRVWDARDNQFYLEVGHRFIDSLRRFLEGVAQLRLRPVADRMQLRDQPILAASQNKIVLAPIAKTILISGAPGTGKTTVLIQRIAWKTKLASLTEQENTELAPEQIDFLFADARSWILFSPSNLLKSYLKEALSRELLPAFDERVMVWDDFRKRVLRDDLRYLRVTESVGFFTLSAKSLLKSHRSGDMAEWTKSFIAALPKFLSADLSDLAQAFDRKVHGARKHLEDEASSRNRMADQVIRDAEGLAVDARADAERKANSLRATAGSLRWICNLAGQAIQLTALSGQQGTNVGWFVQQGRYFSSQLKQSENQQPDALAEDLTNSLNLLRAELKGFAERLSVEVLLDKLPEFYQRFRTMGARTNVFEESSVELVRQRKLDRIEMDTLLFAALKISREVFDRDAPNIVGGVSSYSRLTRNFKTVVGIDEATDFSAVELACMRLIAHPRFDSVTIAGDPMQRLTDSGIEDFHELEFLLPKPELYELTDSYRQSALLLDVAADLYRSSLRREPPFKSFYQPDSADPKPLSAHTPNDEQLAAWLADRISEIYRINGQRLPSIAVLMPSDDHVRSLDARLRPILEERGIDTTACYGGEILGTEARVRLFNVRFIKGLEFEAGFFCYIDDLARQERELVSKYLYVGLTRARSFLGVTYKDNFPSELDSIRSHFSSGDWRHLIPPPQ